MEVVIVDGARTPFGKFGGAYREMPVIDLAATVLAEITRRNNLAQNLVDEVYLGVCGQAQSYEVVAPVIARQALLKAGFPESTVSLTLDRACCSGMAAIQMGYRAILCGQAEVVISGGAENMTLAPFVLHQLRWGQRLGDLVIHDPLVLGYGGQPVAVDAGEVALEHGIPREEQDLWSLNSQQRYQQAKAAGKLASEIYPVKVPGRKGTTVTVSEDEFPRADITIESLAKLPTIYGSPTVTAGNAPGLNDGAAATLLMSRAKADSLGLKPLATVVSIANVADRPRNLASVPAPAIQKVLRQAGLGLKDVSLIEINEAFAAMPLTATMILADNDPVAVAELREKTNVNGGAVAIGHPVGASGARIVMTMAYELHRRGGGYGVASICGGLAQGDSCLIRVD